jgi:ferredoxin
MSSLTQTLREKVRFLLESEKIKYVIGYGEGTHGNITPVFVDNPDDINKLVWSSRCANNLCVYLLYERRKVLEDIEMYNTLKKRGKQPEPVDTRPVAIVAKGCDIKSIIQLINENILQKDDVYIIGVACEHVVSKSNEVYEKCMVCDWHIPKLYDMLIGDTNINTKQETQTKDELENLSVNDRWKYWRTQFEKCLRCYACRQICPLCYCEECVVDPTELVVKFDTSADEKARRPKWIEKSNVLSETIFFHLTRMIHMVGRCTGCGECARACPMNIPLDKLTTKLQSDVRDLFNYEPGTKLGEIQFFGMEDAE